MIRDRLIIEIIQPPIDLTLFWFMFLWLWITPNFADSFGMLRKVVKKFVGNKFHFDDWNWMREKDFSSFVRKDLFNRFKRSKDGHDKMVWISVTFNSLPSTVVHVVYSVFEYRVIFPNRWIRKRCSLVQDKFIWKIEVSQYSSLLDVYFSIKKKFQICRCLHLDVPSSCNVFWQWNID